MVELDDGVVVYRDAASGPVDVVTVEARAVGAVDSNRTAKRAALAVDDRHHAVVEHRVVVAAIDVVGIVEPQEVLPSRMVVLADDGVYALGRAQVSLPSLGAARVIAEDRVVSLEHAPLV